mgnify:CR=1 FL=1
MSAEVIIEAGGGWTIEGGVLWNRANDYDIGHEALLYVEDGAYMWVIQVGSKIWTSYAVFMAAWLRACNHYGKIVDWEVLAMTVEHIRQIKASEART